MPVAAAPLFWAAVASGGAQVGSTLIGNHAAGKNADKQLDATREANRIQQEANDRAIAAEREQIGYERQRTAAQDASRAPYVQASNQALSSLADILKIPGGFNPSAKPPMVQPTGDFAPPSLAGYQTFPMGTATPSRQMLTTPITGASLAQYATGTGTGAPVRGGMVLLEAPTGERRMVPTEEAQRYVARGARVVTGG